MITLLIQWNIFHENNAKKCEDVAPVYVTPRLIVSHVWVGFAITQIDTQTNEAYCFAMKCTTYINRSILWNCDISIQCCLSVR